MRGTVFDVQRGALHDGPGVRTTVFLKGCPLRCAWCHNPESWLARPELSFEPSRCAHCLECAAACPSGAHRSGDGRHVLDRARCTAEGACAAACPSDALSLVGREWTVEGVLAVVERDRPFHERSSGGLTVSGGEPLAQPAFARALLAAAKERGVGTCLDTCGHAPWEDLAACLPFADLVLFDWKAGDPERHERLTGVDGALVRENLGRLVGTGAAVVLRAPLVEGVNDDPSSLDALASVAHRLGLAVEVLPHHALGRDKRARLGRAAGPSWPSASAERARAWVDALRARGARARLG
jgi:pyruvate formate lyase activating enzyme